MAYVGVGKEVEVYDMGKVASHSEWRARVGGLGLLCVVALGEHHVPTLGALCGQAIRHSRAVGAAVGSAADPRSRAKHTSASSISRV